MKFIPQPKPIHKKKVSKVQAWARVREQLRKDFQAAGVITCELGLPGCDPTGFLGFAHTRKRRYVTDLKRVCLGCIECHQKIEYACKKWTGMSMEEYLESIIKKRKQQP